jgi:ATP-binding cassette subfamily B multidrug efflux pump
MALVLQDVFLFTGDIKRNIRLDSENISLETIKQAAIEVGADRFISNLEGGYDHELKERGLNLSVGQRQLVAFARALAFDPAILILDEATSSIDTETEILIQKALKKLLSGRTSIIIAHRLSTIKGVDRIIVMHKGQIREIGTHAELLQKQGIYYRLYQLQYKDQEVATNNG